MSVRIVYKDIAPGAAEDATVTATGADELSGLSMLPLDVEPVKYATLEHNLWIPGDGYQINGGENVPFWSESLSDSNGAFDTPPVVTITFTKRYTSLGLTVDFDPDGRCSRINVAWYQSDALITKKTFYPDAASYFCEKTAEAYDQIVITLLQTATPYRRAKIDKITFGVMRVFERNELRNVNAIMEIDPTSRELASNTLDWTLSSSSMVEYIFQQQQPVLAYDGEKLIGAFYVDGSNRRAETLYDITCIDAIGIMDNDTWPDAVYSGKNAYALAQEICYPFEVDMDDSLKSETVSGILKGETKRTALQQLCFALRAVADTTGTEAVKIFRVRGYGADVIETERTRTGGAVQTNPAVTAITVYSHSYSTAGTGNEIEINGVKYYDTQTAHTVQNPSVVSSDKPNVIAIADATLISEANVESVLSGLYEYYLKRQVHTFKFRMEDEAVGDYVKSTTPWNTTVGGVLCKTSIVLSGITVAEAEVVGVISDGLDIAYPYSGQMNSGDLYPYLGGL